MINKPLINNQIRAREVRLIDEAGQQVGIVSFEEALRMAREKNLDLIQVTEKVDPPVCKIMEYGKYLYSLQKKDKAAKTKRTGEIKGVRLGLGTSLHDIGTKANQSEKFLKEGNRVRVDLLLRGREKALQNFAKNKISQFLEVLGAKIPIKTDRELKKEMRGFSIIISKG